MMDSFLSQDQIVEMLAMQRNRGSYANILREFGIEVPPPRPMTRKEKLQAKWNDYKNRSRKIWQIVCRGYCDEEVEW
jgi:hypothetical protein